MKIVIRIVALLLLSPLGFAQNTITFTAQTTTGVETVIPVLTWDTTPLADDCVASGDWAGSKGGAGTETLAAITSSATYNLTCEWLIGAVTLSWTAPTQNTDGSPLTDLDGYKIYYGQTQGGPYATVIDVSNEGVTSYIVAPLASGNWFFVATAYNALAVESVFSNEAMKNLGLISAVRSIGITVNPKPSPPLGLNVL